MTTYGYKAGRERVSEHSVSTEILSPSETRKFGRVKEVINKRALRFEAINFYGVTLGRWPSFASAAQAVAKWGYDFVVREPAGPEPAPPLRLVEDGPFDNIVMLEGGIAACVQRWKQVAYEALLIEMVGYVLQQSPTRANVVAWMEKHLRADNDHARNKALGPSAARQNALTRSLASNVEAAYTHADVQPDECLAALTAVAITVMTHGGTTGAARSAMLEALTKISDETEDHT